MDEHDVARQQALHEAIEVALGDELDDGDVLASWIVVYEVARLDRDSASAGHFYGPREMTTWRALGLLEWARRFGLTPDPDDGEG